ncbi:MAG: PKD domain-containing protein [Planctomycetota bacterium]
MIRSISSPSSLLRVIALVLSSALTLRAAELAPSFPNHAITLPPPTLTPALSPRASDLDTPFSWDQTAVVYEGAKVDRIIRAYDPQFQTLTISMLPSTPTFLKIIGFDGNIGLLSAQVFTKQAGNTEVLQFQPESRGLTGNSANLIFDIRSLTARLRIAPAVARSPGEFIRPGQIVRYSWTATSNTERFPFCEAELSGRTGIAKGLSSSVITRTLGTKVQPSVLGHYLMLVTPRDVRGQPPLGTTGNGVVFRCVFGSDNLPPVTDGFSADTFVPAVNQIITLKPNATDPETGVTTFANQSFDFGDGSTATGITGSTTHAYTQPGLYRVRATVTDDQGLPATAEDTIIVGATVLPTLPVTYLKQIPPEEAGDGFNNSDSISATFKDPNGAVAVVGDRIVFAYNRNHFERVAANNSATTDTVNIVLGPGKTFSGRTVSGAHITVTASGPFVTVKITTAQFDRTGDPRLGRCDLKGVFKYQRIALAVFPGNNSTPRALVYAGNLQGRVRNGVASRFFQLPETQITGTSTTKDINPRIQEPY